MSEDALKKSMFAELKVMREDKDRDWIIFAFGNYGERHCEKIGLDTEQMIIISNFVGFMIEAAVKLEFKKIIMLGHIAKAIKVAGGIFNTHSRVADGRMETMASCAFLVDEKPEIIRKILFSNTIEEACDYIENVVQSNKINVVGLGPGNIKYLSTAGIDCIKEAEIVVGSTRQLSDLKTIISEKQEVYILGKLSELIAYLKENIERKITIIVSGDTGYYSLVPYLSKNLSKDILNIIPNISSYQYLFSKIGENWQNFRLASVHGREFDYVKNIDDEDTAGLVLLTDDIQNPYEVSKNLYNNGIRNITVIVGENLSYDNEKITILEIEDYEKLNRKFDMNVLVLKKGENYGKK